MEKGDAGSFAIPMIYGSRFLPARTFRWNRCAVCPMLTTRTRIVVFLDCFVKDESVSQERRYAMLDKSLKNMLSPNVQPFFPELLSSTTSLEIRQAEIHEKFRSIRILSKRSNFFRLLNRVLVSSWETLSHA